MAKTKTDEYTGPFIEVHRIGYCENGRARSYIEYAGKRQADKKRPLTSLIVPLIRDLVLVLSYETEAQFTEDIETIKAVLALLKFTSK